MSAATELVVLATAAEVEAADRAGLRLRDGDRRVQLLAFYPARDHVGIIDRGSALEVRAAELVWTTTPRDDE